MTFKNGLSAPETKAGRLQRAALDLIEEHRARRTIPTTTPFLFYEAVQDRYIDKTRTGARRADQDLGEATVRLREVGLVDWDEIDDETRHLDDWSRYTSIAEGVKDRCQVVLQSERGVERG